MSSLCKSFSFEGIHNIIGHYNPSVIILDLVSHTTYVVCINFIHNRRDRDLQFKVDSERQTFLKNFSWKFYFIYSQRFCQKSAERKLSKKYFLYIVLMSSLVLEPWLNLPTRLRRLQLKATATFICRNKPYF